MSELGLSKISENEEFNDEMKRSGNDDNAYSLRTQPMKQNNVQEQKLESKEVPKLPIETNINVAGDLSVCQPSKNEVFIKVEENGFEEKAKGAKFITDEQQTVDRLFIKSEVDAKLDGNEFEPVTVKTESMEVNDSYVDIPELIEDSSNLWLEEQQAVKNETPLTAHRKKSKQATRHEDPQQAPKYKCDKCDYTCKVMSILKKHLWRHEDASNLHMYKCEACGYETRLKGSLKRHQLLHQNPSELRMFQCPLCGFKSKQKSSLKRHMLVHEDPADLHWYKCEKCDFKTKLKSGLKTHQLKHEDPLTARMYKCTECRFSSKYSHSYKDHLLVHKNPSELRMYRCDTCDYQSKYKSDLKSHTLIHKNPSEINMYQCEVCEYATRHKRYLKYHRLKHERAEAARRDKAGAVDVKSEVKSEPCEVSEAQV